MALERPDLNQDPELARDVAELAKDDFNATLRNQLRKHLLAAMSAGRGERLQEQDLRRDLTRIVQEQAAHRPDLLDIAEQAALVDQVLDEVIGYGPIEALMRDHQITDIIINGPRQVFIEKYGRLQPTEVTFNDVAHLLQIARRMISSTGRPFEENASLVDARLPDGSRVNFVAKPPAVNGPLLSIRRFGARPLTTEDLLANESLAPEILEFLAACVKARINLIVTGGTGSGKTTLLNALSRYIGESERIVTIEDTAELEMQQRNVAKMEVGPPGPHGQGGVSIRDLVRNALRMRPDRIVVGECRGGEAFDMLQAMNTGHEGSLATFHANSAREALARIELMIGLAGVDIPVWAVRKLIASSINVIVQVSRLPGGKRKVVTVAEVTGMEGEIYSMQELFEFVQQGVDNDQVVIGHFRATGIRPRCLNKLKTRGVTLSPELFAERILRTQKARERGL
jgi:pilus assembly protein CpaF